VTDSSFYFDTRATGLAVFLGPTEAAIMDLAWKYQRLTVKRALATMNTDPVPAYTTIMTVMNRLVQKGLLERTKVSRHFEYSPLQTKQDFLSGRIAEISDCLDQNFPKYD